MGTDPLSPDTDGDGLGDGVEASAGLDPNKADTDGDGLPDNIEMAAACTGSPAGTICAAGKIAAKDGLRQTIALWDVQYRFTFHYENKRAPDDWDKVHGTIRGNFGLYRSLPSNTDGRPGGCFGRDYVMSCEEANPATPMLPAPCATGTASSLRMSASKQIAQLSGEGGTCARPNDGCQVTVANQALDLGAVPPLSAYYDAQTDSYGLALTFLGATGGNAKVTFQPSNGTKKEDLWSRSISMLRGDDLIAGGLTNCYLGAVPVLARVPRVKLDGRVRFKVPISASTGLTTCFGGPPASGGDVKIHGTITFSPLRITAPEDIDGMKHRVAASQLTYDKSVKGVLKVNYKSEVPSPSKGVVNYLKKNARWTTPTLGSSKDCSAPHQTGDVQVCWKSGATNANDTPLQRRGLEASVDYEYLPPNNNDFGCKLVNLKLNDPDFGNGWQTVGAAGYEVFFEKAAFNNPGDPMLLQPNWYFYYEPINRPTQTHAYVDADSDRNCNQAIPFACWRLIQISPGQTMVADILFFRPSELLQLNRFVSVEAHEQEHDDLFFVRMWGGAGVYDASRDFDNDLAPDDWEEQNGCLTPKLCCPDDPICNPATRLCNPFDPVCWKTKSEQSSKFVESNYCAGNAGFYLADYANPGPNIPNVSPQVCPSSP